MIIIVDERPDVSNAYQSSLGREGMSAASFTPGDFDTWFHSTSGPDLAAVEAFVLGDFERRESFARTIKTRSEVPAIALNDGSGLENTLKLFAAGIDDVVRKPEHYASLFVSSGGLGLADNLASASHQAGELTSWPGYQPTAIASFLG